MKRGKKSEIKSTTGYVRIDPYTWIEKRIDESDETARRRFLDKLTRALGNTKLQPGFNT